MKCKLDCMPVLGPNTKQWWIYESVNDVYIDIPIIVLDEISTYDDLNEQENMLYSLLSTNPDWLYDVDYWVDSEIDI